MFTLNTVYVLYHTRIDALGHENDKCLGVFSSLEEVEKAKEYALKQKGFKDYPDGFSAVEYEINKQEWLEGFGD
ncbi:DUF7336 domain-containing protein [Neisseria wadsworthii]|uniref:DUF7336 domain-containing protein n=1 Tax=Neisseria wadsworthii 9715 TaxID=1030841 RepID=G4CN04_9NEIS|nr:hypothetical protein [Neisseria wadsworthii]EGZ50898.1 hypothetical protein HMPREF9370_0463 [Neisseria wadsworthii 9715]QMT34626.1 hypothetical protein H3L96_04375 [Neisseria wadsworthii]